MNGHLSSSWSPLPSIFKIYSTFWHGRENPTKLATKEELRTCLDSYIFVEEANTKVLERLEEAQLAFALLCSEEDPLEQAWGVAIAAFKSLK